jgi:uncharacterized protein YcgI (DUF1989 family)
VDDMKKHIFEKVMKFGEARAFKLKKGWRFGIKILKGRQVVDLTFRGFNSALSQEINGINKYRKTKLKPTLEKGEVLVDGDGKPVLKLIKNVTNAMHSIQFPGCSKMHYKNALGCRERISKVLGIKCVYLPSIVGLFMSSKNGEIFPSRAKPSDYVEFLVEKDVKVGISVCPGSKKCNPEPGEILVRIIKC